MSGPKWPPLPPDWNRWPPRRQNNWLRAVAAKWLNPESRGRKEKDLGPLLWDIAGIKNPTLATANELAANLIKHNPKYKGVPIGTLRKDIAKALDWVVDNYAKGTEPIPPYVMRRKSMRLKTVSLLRASRKKLGQK